MTTSLLDATVAQRSRPHPDVDRLAEAIRASWGRDTCANPDTWRPHRPSTGQCDATTLVVHHYLGGDLVEAKVFIDCELTEHHYWNRLPDGDLDLTRDQFDPHQDVIENRVLDGAAMAEAGPIRTELLERFELLLRRVTRYLAAP